MPRQILHRPHRHAANYHRAVAGMADPTVLKFRRLPKGIRQCRSRRNLEAHATLRLPSQVHFHHTVTVRQLQLPTSDGRLTDTFHVQTGVRQGCLLSPTIFLLVVDWIMNRQHQTRRPASSGLLLNSWKTLTSLTTSASSHTATRTHRRSCTASLKKLRRRASISTPDGGDAYKQQETTTTILLVFPYTDGIT